MSLTDLLKNVPWRLIGTRRRLSLKKSVDLYMLSCNKEKKEYFVSKLDELKKQYWDVSVYEDYLKD